MRIVAAISCVSIEGDYYQVSFDEHEEREVGDGDYLIVQRQFEMPDDGTCYLETNNPEYIGHFKLKNIEFSENAIVFEIDRQINSRIEVIFSGYIPELLTIRAALEVIQGKQEPNVE